MTSDNYICRADLLSQTLIRKIGPYLTPFCDLATFSIAGSVAWEKPTQREQTREQSGIPLTARSLGIIAMPGRLAEGLPGQGSPQLPFKSEYAQRNGVCCGRRQRLGEKVDARLSQVAQAV